MKRVAVVGGAGRMGQAMGAGLSALGDVHVVAMVDTNEPRELFGAHHVRALTDLDPSTVDAVVDFSAPDGVVQTVEWCAIHHVAAVIGTTGLDSAQRVAVERAALETGIVIASNFSVGAVLSERFAAQAAKYFDRVEIIELHHDRKVDAPSGTAMATARDIAAAREAAGMAPLGDVTERHTLAQARGAEGAGGVRIHSVRLPGLVAHQEVIFGGPGEGLTIRHDSFDRQSFVQGVAVALRAVDASPRLIDGISTLLD